MREYFDLLLLRDVIERNRATNIPALKFLFARLLGHPASAYTINKLFEQMKSLGYRLDKSSITEWIGWFEDCYALYTVPLLTPSIAKQNTNPKKIYSIDNALSLIPNPLILNDYGRLLENAVFLELRRSREPGTIHYYKSKKGLEDDFLVEQENGSKHLIQVCADLQNEPTRAREFAALKEVQNEFGPSARCTLITLEESGEEDGIEILPAWKFFS